MKYNRIICLIFFLLILNVKIAFSQQHLWIDTDLGEDDWLAIAYLVQQPNMKIDAITIVGDGLNDCAHGLPQLKKFLALTHHAEIPIACGSHQPLQENQHFPLLWRENAESFYHLPYVVNAIYQKTDNKNLFAFIKNLLKNTTEKITLVALGPLSNIALAYQQYPKSLAMKIDKIYFTGGNIESVDALSVYRPVVYNQAISWNIFIDPLAFSIVLNHMRSQQLYLVTESAIFPLTTASRDIDQSLSIARKTHQTALSAASQFVAQLLSGQRSHHIPDDAITAVLVNQPSLCQQQIASISAVTSVGKTHPDHDIIVSSQGVKAILCLKLSRQLFINDYLAGIL